MDCEGCALHKGPRQSQWPLAASGIHFFTFRMQLNQLNQAKSIHTAYQPLDGLTAVCGILNTKTRDLVDTGVP